MGMRKVAPFKADSSAALSTIIKQLAENVTSGGR